MLHTDELCGADVLHTQDEGGLLSELTQEKSPLSGITNACYLWGLEVQGFPTELQPQAALLTSGCWGSKGLQQGSSPLQHFFAGLLGGALLHQPLPEDSHVVGPQAGLPLLYSLDCLHNVGQSVEWARSTGPKGRLLSMKGGLHKSKGRVPKRHGPCACDHRETLCWERCSMSCRQVARQSSERLQKS